MKEIKEVAAALERQDYKQAAKLLKQLQKQNPDNIWVQLYIGRWYEETDKLESAEKVYRQLLKDATNLQVVAQARQGLQRIVIIEKKRQEEAIAQAKSDPSNREPGFLILEAIDKENKQEAAQNFARIMKIDPYTARMQLQNAGWRIYRLGGMGELQVYGEELLKVGIPVFWGAIADLEKIHVFRVQHLQSVKPQVTIVCQNESDQLGALSFKWSEVTAKVEGLLPIFMNAMDYDPRRRQQFRHKEMTQDYVNICDLHIPGRRSILRFCDRTYQFQKGMELLAPTPQTTTTEDSSQPIYQNTNRIKWNNLIALLNRNLSNIKVWSDFTPFAETATRDYTQLLSRLKSYIDLSRKQESLWDPAFQLYSALVFLKNQNQGH